MHLKDMQESSKTNIMDQMNTQNGCTTGTPKGVEFNTIEQDKDMDNLALVCGRYKAIFKNSHDPIVRRDALRALCDIFWNTYQSRYLTGIVFKNERKYHEFFYTKLLRRYVIHDMITPMITLACADVLNYIFSSCNDISLTRIDVDYDHLEDYDDDLFFDTEDPNM